MMDLAAQRVASTIYRSRVGTGYNSRLNSVNCGTCFDALYTDLLSVSNEVLNTYCVQNNKYSSNCITNVAVSGLDKFKVCTGGMSLYNSQPQYCTAQERELTGEVFRPYAAVVKCAPSSNTVGLIEECTRSYTGIADAPLYTCKSCLQSAILNIKTQRSNLCDIFGPFAQECLKPFQSVGGALEQFSLCAGYDLDTNPTMCFDYEWDQLGDENLKFSPILLSTVSAIDRISAANAIKTDPAIYNVSMVTSNVTCSSCFRSLTTDIWRGWSTNSTMANTCKMNPFSDACFFDPYVMVARNRFATCSGGHTLLPETYDRCTADEIAYIGESGISALFFKFSLDITTTSEDMVIDYVQTALQQTSTNSSCMYCYMYFAREILRLSPSVKERCMSFNKCAYKEPDLNRIRQGFKTCSGFDLQVDEISSQIFSSTQAPFSVTSYIGIYIGGTTPANSTHSVVIMHGMLLTIFISMLL